jgi:NAD(P)-dependent dehydrogenase (short-subunit alcohol dehydrogenase family)
MQKKKIILIGASGILGKFFYDKLSKDKNTTLLIGADNNLITNLKKKHKTVQLDITSEIQINKFFKSMRDLYGEVDCLINNASFTSEGALKERKNPKKNYFDVYNWNKSINTNLTGVFLCTKYFFKYHNKNSKLQKIITTGSIYGSKSPNHKIYDDENFFCPIGYAASKAGLIGLNKWIATKYGPKNIRSNLLSPGGVYNKHSKQFLNKYIQSIPLRKMAQPDEVYGLLKFLISDSSNYINGENFHVDGGFLA